MDKTYYYQPLDDLKVGYILIDHDYIVVRIDTSLRPLQRVETGVLGNRIGLWDEERHDRIVLLDQVTQHQVFFFPKLGYGLIADTRGNLVNEIPLAPSYRVKPSE